MPSKIGEKFASVFDRPDLLCTHLNLAARTATFILLEEDDYRRIRFHSFHAIKSESGKEPPSFDVSLDGLLELASKVDLSKRKCHYIFFTPYSCSTLLTKALHELGGCMALSEPDLIMIMTGFKRRLDSRPDMRTEWKSLLRLSIVMLSRTFGKQDVAIVKASDDTTSIAADLMAESVDSRAIFLHADLPSYFAQVYKGPEDRVSRMKLLFRSAQQDKGFSKVFGELDCATLTDGQMVAGYWLLLHHGFSAIAESSGKPRVMSMNADTFLGDPEAGLSDAARFFEISVSSSRIREVSQGELFQRSVKDPSQKFSKESREAQIRETLREHIDEFEKAKCWAESIIEKKDKGSK